VIATIRDVTDLNEARKQVEELQKLTTLHEVQLCTLHTQVLGHNIVYQRETMRKVLERTLRLARLDGNVLLTREAGVGKTLMARYLHVMSRRASLRRCLVRRYNGACEQDFTISDYQFSQRI
jgi:transcriptional regulator with PAS, ATPase and Fis domain